MYLNKLTANEKVAFASLCCYAAKANDDFNDAEKQMISEYCHEMDIRFFAPTQIMEMQDIANVFSKSSGMIKKEVIFELLGILQYDGDFDSKEESFAKQFTQKIGIQDEELQKLNILIAKYRILLDEIDDEMNGNNK